jgi:Fe-S-cluster containining protein
MGLDFTPFFKKYEKLLETADEVFERVRKAYPEEVMCKTTCSDCCHALFDLTLIEALYINHQFNQKFSGAEKEALLEKANRADRAIYKLKRKAYAAMQDGKPENIILEELAKERVRCTLLNEKEMCDLYEYRPITCRLYGIPTSIGGRGHTCGISRFTQGNQYPTVNLDIIHRQLYELSAEVAAEIKSKYVKLAEMLIPLSMAVLTDFDEEYLGILNNEPAAKTKE